MFDEMAAQQPSLVWINYDIRGVSEGSGELRMRLFRGLSNTTGRYRVFTQNGTASAGVHFGPIEAIISMPAGVTSYEVVVRLIDNGLVDGSKAFTLCAQEEGGTSLASNISIAIVDNEIPIPEDLSWNPGAGPDNVVYAVALQSDRKLVLGGQFTTLNRQPRKHLGRLHSDGTVDQGFQPPELNDFVRIIAIQPDGRILVAGDFTRVGGLERNRIARFMPDGSLDSGFSPPAIDSDINCMALQGDGRIVIGGEFDLVGGTSRKRIARLNSNGSIDASFHVPGGADDRVRAVAIHNNGRILIGGRFTRIAGAERSLFAALLPSGDLDPEFFYEEGGFNDGDVPNQVRAIAVNARGQIYVGGQFEEVYQEDYEGLARLESDGRLDKSFPNLKESIRAISILPDGRLLAAGGSRKILVLDPSGAPDTTTGLWVGNDVFTVSHSDGNFVYLGGQFGAGAKGQPPYLHKMRVGTVDFGAFEFPLDYGGVEGLSATPIVIRRLGETTGEARVRIHTSDLTAAAGRDYEALDIELVFAPLELEKSFLLKVLNDLELEKRETLALHILPLGKEVAWPKKPGIFSVTDNEDSLLFGNNLLERRLSYFCSEEAAFVAVEISRAPNVPEEWGAKGPMSVRYHTRDLSAKAGLDYKAVEGEIVFQPQERSRSIQIPLLNDTLWEGPEVFEVLLSNPKGEAGLSEFSRVTVEIRDNETGIRFKNSAYQITESGPGLQLELTRGADENELTSIGIEVDSGEAERGLDYQLPNEVVFLPGEISKTIPLTIINDQTAEWDETLLVRLMVRGPGIPGNLLKTQIEILDDDRTGVLDPAFKPVYLGNESVQLLGFTGQEILIADSFSRKLQKYDFNGKPNEGFKPLQFTFQSLLSQPDGSILLGGLSFSNEFLKPLVVRLLPDGKIDPVFTNFMIAFSGAVNSLARQPDGKLLAAGRFGLRIDQHTVIQNLMRLKPDGSPDLEFRVPLDLPPIASVASIGEEIFLTTEGSPLTILKLTNTGELDLEFKRIVSDPAECGWMGSPAKILYHANNLLWLKGDFIIAGQRANLIRIDLSGRLAPGTPFFNNTVESMAPIPGGEFMVTGWFTEVDGRTYQGLAKLNPDGSLNGSFLPPLEERVRYHGALVTPEGVTYALKETPAGESGTRWALVRLLRRPELQALAFPWKEKAVPENIGTVALPITRDGNLSVPLAGKLIVRGISASAGEDFTALSQPVLFSAGQHTFHAVVEIKNDPWIEPDEKLIIELQAPDSAALLLQKAAVITIQDDDRLAKIKRVLLPPGFENLNPVTALRLSNGRVLLGGTAPARKPSLGCFDETLTHDFGLLPPITGAVYALHEQPDGKLLVIADDPAEIPKRKVMRLHANGQLDESFNLPSGWQPLASAITTERGGKVLFGGSSILRVFSDGAHDPTFSMTGYFASYGIHSLYSMPEGKILVNGYVRLEPDGSIDPIYSRPSNEPSASCVDSQGRLLVGFIFPNLINGPPPPNVIRLLPSGLPDPQFRGPSLGLEGTTALLPLRDGKVLAAGYPPSAGFVPIWRFFRIHEDGALDHSFDFLFPLWGDLSPLLEMNDGGILFRHLRSYTVGPGGLYLVKGSPLAQFAGLKRPADSELEFRINSYPGTGWILEASANLVEWDRLAELKMAEGSFFLNKTITSTERSRFYRLRSP